MKKPQKIANNCPHKVSFFELKQNVNQSWRFIIRYLKMKKVALYFENYLIFLESYLITTFFVWVFEPLVTLTIYIPADRPSILIVLSGEDMLSCATTLPWISKSISGYFWAIGRAIGIRQEECRPRFNYCWAKSHR